MSLFTFGPGADITCLEKTERQKSGSDFYIIVHKCTLPATRCQYFRSYELYCSPLQYWKNNCFDPSGEIFWDPVQLRWRTRRRENLQLPSGEVTCCHEESWREEFPHILSGEAYFSSSRRANGTRLAREEGLRGDLRTRRVRRAIWLQEEGQSVFIVDRSRSLEEIVQPWCSFLHMQSGAQRLNKSLEMYKMLHPP